MQSGVNNSNNHANRSYQAFINRNKYIEKTPSKDSLNMTMGHIKFKRQTRSMTKQSAITRDKDIGNLNIKVDENCLSCSGNSGMLTQAFKLACINYHSSKVNYMNTT